MFNENGEKMDVEGWKGFMGLSSNTLKMTELIF